MVDITSWYYTDKTGQRAGPVSTLELRQLLEAGKATSMGVAWKEGMENWTPISQIEEFKSITIAPLSPPKPAPSPLTEQTGTATQANSETVNPYSAPQSRAATVQADFDTPRCGGIGRLIYFLSSIAVGIIYASVIYYIELNPVNAESTLAVTIGMYIFLYGSIMTLMAFRHKNMGLSPWWCLLYLVPIGNLIVGIRSLAYQEGWAYTRKLDLAGKIIVWLVIGSIAIALVFACAGIAMLR